MNTVVVTNKVDFHRQKWIYHLLRTSVNRIPSQKCCIIQQERETLHPEVQQ